MALSPREALAPLQIPVFRRFWIASTASNLGGSSEDLLERIMAAPLVRCDEVQWSLFGISMAGWNAILSIASALVILWLSLKSPRKAI